MLFVYFSGSPGGNFSQRTRHVALLRDRLCALRFDGTYQKLFLLAAAYFMCNKEIKPSCDMRATKALVVCLFVLRFYGPVNPVWLWFGPSWFASCISHFLALKMLRAVMLENVTSDECAQRSFQSACAFAQWPESSLGAFWIAKDTKVFHADNEDSNQTARMRSLVRVFVGRTCKKLCFLRLGSFTYFRWPYWSSCCVRWCRDSTNSLYRQHFGVYLQCVWKYR